MTWQDRLADLPVLGTALAVQERYRGDAAPQFAAAMAYFGFLALFPALLLALSLVGYFLESDPTLRADVTEVITRAVPGLERQIGEMLELVRDTRAATGVIGVAGLVWSLLRIVDSATIATSRTFRVEDEADLFTRTGRNLLITVVLGSLLVAGAGAATLVGFDVSGPRGAIFSVGGTLVSVVVDTVLFLVSYRLLTAHRGPHWRDLLPGAVLAGVAWTALKVVGSTFVASRIEAASTVYGPFATVVGIFLLLYLAARIYLYGAELNAVRCERRYGRADGRREPRGEDRHEDRSGVTALP